MAAILAWGLSTSCGSGTGACVTLPSTCTPSFNTDYKTIYANVFSQRCGTTGGNTSCHGPAGNQGRLSLGDSETAYNSLIGLGAPHARVLPGDPACSILMERLETDDVNKRMPRGGDKLPDGMLCAIQQWIDQGATQ